MQARTLFLAASVASAFQCAQAADVTVPAGQAVFDRVCAACHQKAGVGMPGLAPALAKTLAPVLAKPEGRRYLASVLTQGLSGPITSQGQVFMGAMPSQAAMSDAELVDVANYVASELNGVPTSLLTTEDFTQARAAKTPHKDLRELRAKLLK